MTRPTISIDDAHTELQEIHSAVASGGDILTLSSRLDKLARDVSVSIANGDVTPYHAPSKVLIAGYSLWAHFGKVAEAIDAVSAK